MKVAEVMSRRVVALRPTSTFREIWSTIFQFRVNSLPVTDSKRHILGIITREELLEHLYPDYKELFATDDDLPDLEELEKNVQNIANVTAQDIMRKRVIYTNKDTHIMRALSRMIVHRINQLPVISEKNVLIGIITKGDIFNSVFKKNISRLKLHQKRKSK